MRPLRLGLSVLTALTLLGSLGACQPAPLAPAATEAADGAVSVRVQLPRRLQAVADDVERVSIRLENYNRVPYIYERSLDRTAIEAGQAVTFTGLITTHSQELLVKAYDAQNRVIGQGRDFVTPTGTGVQQRTVRLYLAPTYTAEAPTTGDIRTDFTTLTDLPTVGTVTTSHPSPLEWAGAMAVDTTGAVWLSEEDRLVKMAPDGRILIDKRLGNLGTVYDLHTDSQNHVWAAMANGLRKFDPNGNQLLVTANFGGVYQFTVDHQDHPWVAAYHGVVKVGTDGTVLASYTQPGTQGYQGRNVVVDPTTDTVWVHNGTRPNQHGAKALVARFSTDGTFLGETVLDRQAYNFNLLVHPDGHLWMFNTDADTQDRFIHMSRLAPDGTEVTRTPAGVFGGQLALDPQGNLWLARGSEHNNLYKVSANGTPLGVNTVDGSNGRIVAAPDGTFWVHGNYKIHKFAP